MTQFREIPAKVNEWLDDHVPFPTDQQLEDLYEQHAPEWIKKIAREIKGLAVSTRNRDGYLPHSLFPHQEPGSAQMPGISITMKDLMSLDTVTNFAYALRETANRKPQKTEGKDQKNVSEKKKGKVRALAEKAKSGYEKALKEAIIHQNLVIALIAAVNSILFGLQGHAKRFDGELAIVPATDTIANLSAALSAYLQVSIRQQEDPRIRKYLEERLGKLEKTLPWINGVRKGATPYVLKWLVNDQAMYFMDVLNDGEIVAFAKAVGIALSFIGIAFGAKTAIDLLLNNKVEIIAAEEASAKAAMEKKVQDAQQEDLNLLNNTVPSVGTVIEPKPLDK